MCRCVLALGPSPSRLWLVSRSRRWGTLFPQCLHVSPSGSRRATWNRRDDTTFNQDCAGHSVWLIFDLRLIFPLFYMALLWLLGLKLMLSKTSQNWNESLWSATTITQKNSDQIRQNVYSMGYTYRASGSRRCLTHQVRLLDEIQLYNPLSQPFPNNCLSRATLKP